MSAPYQLVVNPAPTTTTLTSTPTNNLSVGSGPVVFTASVAVVASAGNPPGTVTFFDTGAVPVPGCINVAVTAANPAIATCSVTFDASSVPKSAGNHSYTATYTPTPATPQNFVSSTSTAIAFVVSQSAAVSGTLTTVPASPIVYSTATIARIVYSPPASSPALTGTVSFFDGGTLLGSQNVVSGGNTDFTLPNSVILSSVTHTLTAKYNGDSNYTASAVSAPYLLVVNPAPSTTTLTSTPTNNLGIGSGPVVFTAKVAVVATAGNPPGTVTFFDNGTVQIPGCASLAVTAANPAVATCSVTFDASSAPKGSGNHSYTAVYTPTPATPQNFVSSTSNAIAFAVGQMSAIAGPLTTVPGSPIAVNTPTIARIVFSPPPSGPALTGTVSFYDGGILLGSQNVVSGGNTDFGLPNSVILTVGTHTLTAQYNGDSNYIATPLPLPTTALVVNKPPPAPTTATTTTLGTTNPAPAYNSTDTYIIRVTGSTPPQGTVTVVDTFNGTSSNVAECTLLVLTPDAGSTTTSSASCVVLYNSKDPQHSSGVHVLTASFSTQNASNWTNSTSQIATITVGKPVTIVSQPTVVPTAITVGMNVTFSTTVTSTKANPTFAPNTVQFYDNGVPLGSPVTPNATTGVASFTTTTPLALGTHNITAMFLGDVNYAASVMSSILVVTVTASFRHRRFPS